MAGPRDQYDIQRLIDLPESQLSRENGSNRLKGTNLSECTCGTMMHDPIHDRFKDGNPRTKIENHIVNHIIQYYPRNRQIKILSMAAGSLLQDLIIIIRLIKAGFHSISITLVEPDNRCQAAYQDFKKVIQHLTDYHKDKNIDLDIQHRFFTSVTDQGVEMKYDIVYAIDFNMYYVAGNGATKPQGLSRDALREEYFPVIDLLKAFNLCDSDSRLPPLVIDSSGEDIVCFTDNTLSSFNMFHPLADFFNESINIGAFYINANIYGLLQNIAFFKEQRKPVLINQYIIKNEDRSALRKFLEKNNITSFFVNGRQEDEVAQLAENDIIVVVDFCPYKKQSHEDILSPVLNKKNIYTVRLDTDNMSDTTRSLKDRFILFPPLQDIGIPRVASSLNGSIWDESEMNKGIYKEIFKEKLPTLKKLFEDISGEKPSRLKSAYLEELSIRITRMREDQKIKFAYFLITSEKHLLQFERHRHNTKNGQYSNETKSMFKAIEMLLGDKFTLENGKIYLNEQLLTLTRHNK